MNLMEKYSNKMQAQVTETPDTEGPCNDMVTPPAADRPAAPDTDLFNVTLNTWLEKISDSEWDIYEERAAIMEYDGGFPREQAEIEAIKKIIQERIIPGKCDKCERVNGCMMIPWQRVLCEVIK